MGRIDVEVYPHEQMLPEVMPDMDLMADGWEVKLSPEGTPNRRGKRWYLYRNPVKNILGTEWIPQPLARYFSEMQVTMPSDSAVREIAHQYARNQQEFEVVATVAGYELLVQDANLANAVVVMKFDTYGELLSTEARYRDN